MTPIRKLLGIGALGMAMSVAAALPASSAEAVPSGIDRAAGQAGALAYPGESYAQYRRYGYRGGYRFRRRGYGGGAVAAGVIGGLALGALAAGAAAPAYGYGAPAYGYGGGYGGPGTPVGNVYGADPNYVSYCASRYRSFDPRTGTYLASDGYRYHCE